MSKVMVGHPAPKWEAEAVVEKEFVQLSSERYLGKFVVLVFYPMDFSFVCPTEIISFSDRSEEFRKINCEIIACSTDSEYCHLAWINAQRKDGGLGDIRIPLLSDKKQDISKNFGVLSDAGTSDRALFIIDGLGTLRQVTINDSGVGRSVDEVLRLVKAIQFYDSYGEVCPANWHPGDTTIKLPDKKDAAIYFKKNVPDK